MAHNISDFQNNMIFYDYSDIKLNNLTIKQAPIFLLIDNSASMFMMADKMSNTVNKVVSILSDDIMVPNPDIYVLTFNDRVTILNDRNSISKNYNLDINYEGASFLGLALNTVLEFIETKRVQYKQATPANKFSTPLLLVFSDGYTYSNCIDQELYKSSITRIKKEVSADYLNVFSFALGEKYDYNNLCDITGLSDSGHVIIVENGGKWFDDFEDFFFLSD